MKLMKSSIDAILENIKCAEQYLIEEDLEEFKNTIINSNNVFLMGAGRSGLVARAFAMRLMHLGISAYVVGETITPAIYDNDCIIAVSGSGETDAVLSAVEIAKDRGSKVLALTSYPKSSIGKIADVVLVIKGRTKVEEGDENYMKRQFDGKHTLLTPLGTAFELTSLVFLDAIVAELMDKLHKTEADLKSRHTVLE